MVPTIVYYNGQRLAADRVRFRRAGEYEFAVADDAGGQAFERLLEDTAMGHPSADFTTLAWRKLLINAVANPVTALTLQRQAVFRREDIHALCLAILEEAATVGRADGAQRPRPASANHDGTFLTYPHMLAPRRIPHRLAGPADASDGAIVAAGARTRRGDTHSTARC